MILKRNLVAICFSLLLAITATGCQVSAQQSDGSQTSTEVSTSTLTETNSEETFFNTEQVHTIDGKTFQNVGLKLKGNSTLKSAIQQSTDSLNAEELPWVIRLDKYMDDQAYLGRTRFVIRKNNTESSMNEALALAMLEEAGVATQASAFTRFTVNGSAEKLTLVVDVPDDDLWTEEQFGATTLARFQDLLRSEAADLIDEETITSEGEAITQFLTGTNTVNPYGDKQEEAKTGDTTDVDTPESTTP